MRVEQVLATEAVKEPWVFAETISVQRSCELFSKRLDISRVGVGADDALKDYIYIYIYIYI